MSVTKRDIALGVAEKTGLTQMEALNAVQATLDYIAGKVAAGETVELRNFGVFEIRETKSRIGRNPKKPENAVIIPAGKVVKFRAGKELKEQLQKLK